MASGDKNESNSNKQIKEDTIEIFTCYCKTQFEIDRERNNLPDTPPCLPPEDLPDTPDNRNNVSWIIGKKLAIIADTLVIDEHNRALINDIVQLVNVGPDDSRAFEEFTKIAARVLSNGITWQSVATLFYFGYCIARDRLTKGVRHYLSQLLKWILNVFSSFGVFEWIARQGGWANLLGYDSGRGDNTESVFSSQLLQGAAVIGVVALVCVVVYRYYNSRS